MAEDSGTIVLDGDVIRYASTAYGSWEMRLDAVKIIGEATNQNGPFLDDWFLCFAPTDRAWSEASMYAEGAMDFLKALSLRLGSTLLPRLAASADFASVILWPPEVAGQPMFQYRRRSLGNEQTFSELAKRVIGSPGE